MRRRCGSQGGSSRASDVAYGPRVLSSQIPYAELHVHSNFSFLDGASHPEELVDEAARLGLEALALTDHNGLYGVVRFAEAARRAGVHTVFGAEITLEPGAIGAIGAIGDATRGAGTIDTAGSGSTGTGGAAGGAAATTPGRSTPGRSTPRRSTPGRSTPRRSTPGRSTRRGSAPDPEGPHLVVLARDPHGYSLLSREISKAQLAGGSKGSPLFDLGNLSAAHQGHWLVTTACRKGSVAAALSAEGPRGAARELDKLISAFGRENVAVELWNHDDPIDTARNDALARLAISRGTELIATSNAHYAGPAGYPLASALAAVRARRTMDEINPWLPAGPSAFLRSGAEQSRRFARFPGVVERSGEIGRDLAFDLQLITPGIAPFATPAGYDEMSYLRALVTEGATSRYGPRSAERVPGAWRQIDHELEVIEELELPGYFLIVWDVVLFCREHDIYCQGRGSAANSAVCYALGITNADAVALGLLFERFLSTARASPPDIDLDIESSRREEVIQYVYSRYGRHHAAQVANVICYRSRSAARDSANVLAFSPPSPSGRTRHLGPPGDAPCTAGGGHKRGDIAIPQPAKTLAAKTLAARMEGIPRHLGVHSGGMVVCDQPVIDVCPVEWATAPGRTVLQWDKDDCAAVGLVKFDLLGLGMLDALHRTIDVIKGYYGTHIDLATLPQEQEVYEMLGRADTVGVFQVESRAQMATLPRLRPTSFYDLVIEVAIIRPGPIQGGSVHPYLRRRNGEEDVSYPHPLLEACLKKTLGVPLFQEQLMQMAIDVAGFSATEADELRQAMSSKRSAERMESLRDRFYAGMAKRSVTGAIADEIFSKMAAFANFGFPESHAISFAYLVYASAWLKLRYPAAFLTGLLRSQPMGFWSPRTLVADARRHGVDVRRADVNISSASAKLEEGGSAGDPPEPAVRLGLASVRGIGKGAAERIAAGSPYESATDLAGRAGLSRPQMEALALAGATASLDAGSRRRSLWLAAAAAEEAEEASNGLDRLEGTFAITGAPPMRSMDPREEVAADLWATGVSTSSSLTEHERPLLDKIGVVPAARLAGCAHGQRVKVAGMVTHRQRPRTARGTTFVNLEDETGLVNVICSIGVWARYRGVAESASALIVSGRIELAGGALNIVAERLEPLALALEMRSRDFC